MRVGKKIRIVGGTHTIVVKNPEIRSDRRTKTLDVNGVVQVALDSGFAVAFGEVLMNVENVVIE